MQSGIAQVRQRINGSLDAELTVILDASGEPSSRLRARYLGQEGEALKIQVFSALGQGLLVSVAGEIETGLGRQPLLGKFRVRGCRLAGAGKYLAELYPEAAQPQGAPQETSQHAEDVDYYEVLQVSRRADSDTIHRVFHLLAQRYHPDNRDTGNHERFRQLVEAHTVLCDPARRAAHDVRLAEEDKTRFKIFDTLQSTQGVQAETRKRKGILRILYSKRLSDPHSPSLRMREMVEMLGCPAEHLEFSIWFLRENKYLVRTDNNQFEITYQGVTAFEAEESTFGKKQVLTLPAPQGLE